MGWLLDILFGKAPSIEQGSALDANQQALAQVLTQFLSQGMLNPTQPYGGSLNAEASETETALKGNLAALLAQLGGVNVPGAPNLQLDSGMMGAIGNALTGALQPFDPQATSEFFNKSIAAPMMTQFKQDILPQIQESFAGPGTYWGSARADAERKAANQVQSDLTTQLSNLMYQGQNDAASRALQAAGLGMNYARMPAELQNMNYQNELAGVTANLQKYGMAGDMTGNLLNTEMQDRQMRQHANELWYQDWLRTRPENSPYAQMVMAYLGIPTTYTAINPGTQGIVGALAGLAGQLLPSILKPA